jgi:O-antigen ligase
MRLTGFSLGNALFPAVGLILVLAMVFGGATRSGFLADVLVQIFSIPLLFLALLRQGEDGKGWGGALAFCLVIVMVPLLQLIPLPPALWTRLPMRETVVGNLSLIGHDLDWRPLSLTPHATWVVILSLIPPLAVFLSVRFLSYRERRYLVVLLLAFGVLASLVGLMQVAQGPDGWLQDFGLATRGDASGFFANRNHFGALSYSLFMFAAAFAIVYASNFSRAVDRTEQAHALALVIGSFVILVVLLAAGIIARSRAGLGLMIVALLGAAALASSQTFASGTGGLRGAQGGRRVIAAAVGLVLLFGSQFALYRLLERFEADPLGDARVAFARNTWEAAWTFMPFGSGLGSFVPVYQMFERPEDALLDKFANRAHNDLLEVWLEAGIVGLLLISLFLGWLVLMIWRVWRPTQLPNQLPIDVLLMRAASVVLVLLLLHSLVDYPLRTTALSVLFAFCCGLLLPPDPSVVQDMIESTKAERHDARPRDVEVRETAPSDRAGDVVPSEREQMDLHKPWPEADRPAETTGRPTSAGGQWGDDIHWPDAWQKPSSSKGGEPDKDQS